MIHIRFHPEFEKEIRDSIPKDMSLDLCVKWVFLDAWVKAKHDFGHFKHLAESRAHRLLRQKNMQDIEKRFARIESLNAQKTIDPLKIKKNKSSKGGEIKNG